MLEFVERGKEVVAIERIFHSVDKPFLASYVCVLSLLYLLLYIYIYIWYVNTNTSGKI